MIIPMEIPMIIPKYIQPYSTEKTIPDVPCI